MFIYLLVIANQEVLESIPTVTGQKMGLHFEQVTSQLQEAENLRASGITLCTNSGSADRGMALDPGLFKMQQTVLRGHRYSKWSTVLEVETWTRLDQ